MKVKGRIYVEIPVVDVQPADLVRWVDNMGTHHNKVLTLHKGKEPAVSVERHPHEGTKPIRVSMKQIKQCWRWHKNAETTAVAAGAEVEDSSPKVQPSNRSAVVHP